MPTKRVKSKAAVAFGQRIRECRVSLDLSQIEFAERCGLHWTYVGSVERGERNLSLHNILVLARAADVDAGELLRGLKP